MLSDSWGESFGLNAQFRGHKGMVEAARYRYLICFGCMPHGNGTTVGCRLRGESGEMYIC